MALDLVSTQENVYVVCLVEHKTMDEKSLRAGFGVLKKCCAMYNMSEGKLDKSVGEAIVKAADEVSLVKPV